MWKSKFYGAFVLNHRVVLHAIDAKSARWRGDAGSSQLEHPTHWLISTQVVTGGRRHASTVPAKGGPFIVGATVAGMICLVGPLTGAGFNPARDLAPRIVAALAGGAGAFPAGWWIYSLGPVVGAVVGASLCMRCLGSDSNV